MTGLKMSQSWRLTRSGDDGTVDTVWLLERVKIRGRRTWVVVFFGWILDRGS